MMVNTTGRITSYADDTTIVYTGCSSSDVKRKAELDLPTLFTWFSSNSLTVNTAKTIFTPIGHYQDSLPNYRRLSIQDNNAVGV